MVDEGRYQRIKSVKVTAFRYSSSQEELLGWKKNRSCVFRRRCLKGFCDDGGIELILIPAVVHALPPPPFCWSIHFNHNSLIASLKKVINASSFLTNSERRLIWKKCKKNCIAYYRNRFFMKHFHNDRHEIFLQLLKQKYYIYMDIYILCDSDNNNATPWEKGSSRHVKRRCPEDKVE